MNEQVVQLQRKVDLLQRGRALIVFGLPACVSALWMVTISKQFMINWAAIKSGVFVFAVAFLPLALAHAFTLAIFQQRLADAERDARVPKAVARDSVS
jgi:hypothetical protein